MIDRTRLEGGLQGGAGGRFGRGSENWCAAGAPVVEYKAGWRWDGRRGGRGDGCAGATDGPR